MTIAITQPLHTADQRTTEILDGVREVFAKKGFDGASMQDLARATGISVGNFYRYFPSKTAIVEALIARDLAEVEAEFAAILNSDDPMATLRQTIRHRIETVQCKGDGQIWAEISAAALRRSEIGTLNTRMESEVTGYLTTVFARVTGLTIPEARARFGAQAMFIMMMVKASAMHPAALKPEMADLNALVLRMINKTLDEIVDADAKG
jgi:AcrR family transcriptional regulator